MADMKSVLNETDYLIAEKFYKGTDGNWYNQKMTDVMNERKEYTANRLKNFQKKDDMKLHMNSHMELHTGDETVDETVNKNLDDILDKNTVTTVPVKTRDERQNELAETMADVWEQLTKTI